MDHLERGSIWIACSRVGTVVHLAVDGVYAGHILISDVMKPHAEEAGQSAETCRNVTKTVMFDR